MIVGLRAGDLHPAQGRDDLPQIHARVELVESLGGESMAYFRVDARQIKSEAAEEEEILASDGRRRDGRRLAPEPRRVVPAARPAEARRRGADRRRHEEPPLLR